MSQNLAHSGIRHCVHRITMYPPYKVPNPAASLYISFVKFMSSDKSAKGRANEIFIYSFSIET